MDNKVAALELGTKPVGKLLMQYALPAIIAMTASSLYNMVDSIFIGQGVGALAISGLAITFPFMNLAGAFGAGVGVGASTYISVKLGQKDYRTAQHILGNTMTLNLIIGLAFGVVCLLFLNPILYFFGASPQTLPYAREYMIIILAFNVLTHTYLGMNAVLRAAGKPREAMYATMFTVLLNTALDPLFIYTFHMGIAGAAYATVLAQALALVWQLRLFSDKRELLHFTKGTYALSSRIVKNIVGIGLSPFSMNVCACLVVIFINRGLMEYGGDMAVGAYGIANRVAFIFIMVNIGVNQGMQPIAGYNYGSAQFDRLIRVLNLALLVGTIVTTMGFILGELFPYYCARLFTKDSTLLEMSVRGIRIMMAVFPIIGSQMVITNFFQSIGMAKISIFLSLSRQLLFLLPCLFILPPLWGVDGVWWSMPIADCISFIVAWWFILIYMRKFKQQQLK